MCYQNPQRGFVFLFVYGVFVFTISAEKKKKRKSENGPISRNILLNVVLYYGKVGLRPGGTWNLGLTPERQTLEMQKQKCPFSFCQGGGAAGAQALVSCFHTGLKITYTSIKARSPGPHPPLPHSPGQVRIGVSVTTGIRQGQGTYVVPCLL